jgi:fatty-acyl-CoA synthase
MTLTESYWPEDTSAPMLASTTGGLLRSIAAEVPDRVALIEGTADPAARRSWTYAELLAEAEHMARAMLQHFSPGDRIAIWAPNGAEWVILQQAAGLAGLVLVTVNPAYRKYELEYVLRQSETAGIFHAREYRGHDLAAAVAAVRDDLPELRLAVCIDDLDTFTATGDKAAPLPDVQLYDPSQIQYTSGTTGKPKGAVLHHLGVVNASRFVTRGAGVEDGAVWVSAMPMFHIGGSLTEIGTFAHRGTYIVVPAFDPGLMLELFETYRATTSLLVPTMLHAMLEHPDSRTRDVSALTTVMSGASFVPARLVEQTKERFGCRFSIVFGQTELHGVICQTKLTDSAEDQSLTIGSPLPHVEVKIIDPASGDVLPIGESGEICARGYQTMLRYHNMPEQSAATMQDDGWLHSGDLGSMDGRGYLKITGRIKDMIIRGGENIYPREIEDLLLSHPAVAEVAVIGIHDEKWGELVCAVIRPVDPNDPPGADALRELCLTHLAKHKAPARWYYVDELPATPTGKIQKFKLRDGIVAGEQSVRQLTEKQDSLPANTKVDS